MAIETNLNNSPYFDDFDETSQYHRILFRPGYSVQARELTQIQSILQNQIEKFANEVIVDGTVVSGCSVKVRTINYVKLRDKDFANSRIVLLNDFYDSGKIANVVVTGTLSGVQARLIDVRDGSEVGIPNNLTMFVDYLNSGTDKATKVFNNDEELIFTTNGQTRSAGFKFAANTIKADSFGDSTGKGLYATVSDGTIYHKGHFIHVEPQGTVASKYDLTANVNIGFETRESIVDSNQDVSLLDNATGATNFSAPGANRLKLIPTLATRARGVANTQTFFTIAEMDNGEIVRRNTDTRYAEISNHIAAGVYDSHGNFAMEPFNVRIREHLKNESNLGRYADGDSNKLVCEVERGSGYIMGRKVSLTNAMYRSFDKATETEVFDGVAIGQNIGNYVFINEVVGLWNFTQLVQVDLYDTAQTAVTSKLYGISSATGVKIGTAYLRGFEYESGVSGTASGKYRAYLFNIEMNSGQSFKDVKGLYVNNAVYSDSLADIVLENDGSAKLYDSSLESSVFPLQQGGTKLLTKERFRFRQKSGGNVQQVNEGQVTIDIAPSYLSEAEALDVQGTLTGPAERSYVVVAKEASETIDQPGTIDSSTQIGSTQSSTIQGNGTKFRTTFRVGDVVEIGPNGSHIGQGIVASIASDTEMVLDSWGVTDFTGETYAYRISFPSGYIFDFSSNGQITTSTDQITIDFDRGVFTGDFEVDVYYDVKRGTDLNPASQADKDVNKNKFVHINTANNVAGSSGPWSLGVADAFKLRKVYKGTVGGVGTGDTDVTTEFELVSGQKDSFYDISTLRKKSTSTLNTTDCGLMVEFDYFTKDETQGIGFMTIESYPVDDANPTASDKIATSDIPYFVSPKTGNQINLRDAVDFRFYKQAGTIDGGITCVPSATGTVASAPTNPSLSTSFKVNASGAHPISPDKNFECSAEFYLPRRDRVCISSEGTVEVVKGRPDRQPSLPAERSGAMTIATLNIPVYPSLSPFSARQTGKQEYAVTMELVNNRRFTMQDLRQIDNRLKKMEYYSSLNFLENSVSGKQLLGTDGTDRFKNGFLVDNFDGHNVADTRKVGYSTSIDRNRNQLRPRYKRKDVPFKTSTLAATNMQTTGDLISLNYSTVEQLDQRFASKLRNPVQEIQFNWQGEVLLNPSIDNTPDITTLPEIQVDFDGMYEAIEFLAAEAGVTGTDWGNWRTTSQSSVTQTTGSWNTGDARGINQTTTTQTDQIRNGVTTSISPSNEEFSLGTFVENVAVRDFMRSRPIQFTGVRMRPNTIVFPYFDDERVSEYCTPVGGARGDSLITDAQGKVEGTFVIPNDNNLKFRIGTKRFELKDVANTQTQAALLSTSAHGDFTSIPLSVDQRSSSINIKTPQFSKNQVIDNRALTSTTNQRVVTWRSPPQSNDDDDNGPSGNDDPLSQSFSVSADLRSQGIFVTSIDLWFGKKHAELPITLQIREMENGYPSPVIVPFGSLTKDAGEINVNASSAIESSKTTFTFESPVFLHNRRDYCFTLIPGGNNPEYAVWCAELGQTDIDTNELIHKPASMGVMFVSSNDKTWTAIQKEDVKFRINKAKFSTRTNGTYYIENEDIDYLTVDAFTNGGDGSTFIAGETIRAESILRIANTDSVSDLGIQVGSIVQNRPAKDVGSNTQIYANGVVRQIINTSETMTCANGDTVDVITIKIDGFGDFSNSTTDNVHEVYVGTTLVGNTVEFFANTNVSTLEFLDVPYGKMDIKVSTVNSTKPIATGTYLRGQDSGASCKIVTIDNLTVNTLVPKIPYLTYANTSASWEVRPSDISNDPDGSYRAIDVEEENDLRDETKAIFSFSNQGATGKSMLIKGTFRTEDPNVSPIVDKSRITGIVVENIINNDSTGEYRDRGNSEVRYMTKPVVLGDGNEAEDIKVFLTAYKPSGTDIKVYAKVLSDTDGQDFDDKDWSPLRQLTSANTFSDSVDVKDLREFEYGFGSIDYENNGFLTLTNVNGNTALLSVGDIVGNTGEHTPSGGTFANASISEIISDNESGTIHVKVTGIATNTYADFVSLAANNDGVSIPGGIQATALSFTANSHAHLNSANSSVVTYVTQTGERHHQFKTFAVKIVLTSTSSHIIPIVNDMRTIALQV